jgi:hypothetical protein
MMKTIRFSVLLMTFVTLFACAASAQKASTRRPVPRATPKTSTLPPLDVRAARVKVSNQYSNVSQFVAIMGPIAENIESLDGDIRANKASKSAIDLNNTNKQKVLTAIRGLKAGIVTLETEFKTKPALKLYLTNIQGISDLATQADTLASSGKFVASRDQLRTVAQKLSDTLNAMPTAEL